MSLFTNQNFISQLIKQQGASDYFEAECLPLLQALIEAETSTLTEKAAKHMDCDRRDHLTSEDVNNAIKEMGHQELIRHGQRSEYLESNSQYLLKDDYSTINAFIEEEIKGLTNFSMPNLRGRYIYLDQKIPRINENHALKTLKDMRAIKEHQNEEKKKLFNIIRDEPVAQLTKEELDYYNQVVNFISGLGSSSEKSALKAPEVSDVALLGQMEQLGIDDSGGTSGFGRQLLPSSSFKVSGCITNVMPMVLKYISKMGVNENAIAFLLEAIDNKFVWESLDYHLHQILVILMAYEGNRALEVGIKIGYIVSRFGDKYHNLYDLFEGAEDSAEDSHSCIKYVNFSNITKKIGFEIVTGIPVRLSLKELKFIEKAGNQDNSSEAALCMRVLIENWSQISCLKSQEICEEYGYVYWYGGCKDLEQDPYLAMF